MSKDAPPPAPRPTAPRTLARWLLQVGAPLLAGAGLLAGVLLLGGRARESLRGRVALPLADVDCDPPAGMSRAEFLAEVQYLGNLPDSLDLLAPDLGPRLSAAFARHPWVASVEKVEKRTPRGLRAALTFRTPVLAVCLPGRARSCPCPCRAVDRHGVLLPRSPAEADLPTLVTPVAPPAGPPGTPWGDARVSSAARTADYLLPHLPALKMGNCRVEVDRDEVTLRAGRTRTVRWGHPPGREATNEPAAPVKLRHLLDRRGREREVDLRRIQ
jgi:hypothetical protein